jgi:hypothetical protein
MTQTFSSDVKKLAVKIKPYFTISHGQRYVGLVFLHVILAQCHHIDVAF